MRLIALPILWFGLMMPCFSAEPNRLTIQWIELDSTQEPELTKQLAATNPIENSERVLSELRDCKSARVLVHHEMSAIPGSRVNQSTQIGDATFHLNLGIEPVDQESFTIQYVSSLETLFPGADIDRRTEVKTIESAFKLSPGNSFVLTGLERSDHLKVTTQVLVVSLRGPAPTPLAQTVPKATATYPSPGASISKKNYIHVDSVFQSALACLAGRRIFGLAITSLSRFLPLQ